MNAYLGKMLETCVIKKGIALESRFFDVYSLGRHSFSSILELLKDSTF